jgi:hypothetical protein
MPRALFVTPDAWCSIAPYMHKNTVVTLASLLARHHQCDDILRARMLLVATYPLDATDILCTHESQLCAAPPVALVTYLPTAAIDNISFLLFILFGYTTADIIPHLNKIRATAPYWSAEITLRVLRWACLHGHTEVVRHIITQWRDDTDAIQAGAHFLFLLAGHRAHIGVIHVLMELFARNEDLETAGPLDTDADEEGNVFVYTICDQFTDITADPGKTAYARALAHVIDHCDNHFAAYRETGHLLSYYAVVCHALYTACMQNQQAVLVAILTSKWLPVRLKAIEAVLLLETAIEWGNPELTCLLVSTHPATGLSLLPVPTTDDYNGYSLYELACHKGHVAIAARLLPPHVDLAVPAASGACRVRLQWIQAAYTHSSFLVHLVQLGVSALSDIVLENMPPLHRVCTMHTSIDRMAIAHILVEHFRAPVTPLAIAYAAQNGFRELAEYLRANQ